MRLKPGIDTVSATDLTHLNRRRLAAAGFSLIELLIAIAIVAILAGLAMPSYQEYVLRSNRTDCQSSLLDASNRQERFYYDNRTYTVDMTDLGYSLDDAAPSPEGHYTIDAVAATAICPIGSCFVMQCTAVGAQAKDGNLTLSSSGQKLPADKW